MLGALALAAPAVADNAGLTPVEPHSPNAQAINTTWYLVLAITGVIFVLVQAALIGFVIAYRRGKRPRDAEAPQIHGHSRLELMWTVVPVLILALIAAFVFVKLPEIEDAPRASAAAPGETLEIEVQGRQFYWQFTYPDGSITYDTLLVPVDRVVELRILAPEHDVVHSWWIPALGGKFDAIPGLTSRTWFRADEEGEYEGRCTEFCGLQHGAMTASVRAVSADSFDSELATVSRAMGAQAFEAVCAKCHNVEGPQLIGPSLRGNTRLADKASLRTLVEQGFGQMPAVGRGWTDEQIDALFEHVRQYGEVNGG
jgi:cytochrome c oxidase subunit II